MPRKILTVMLIALLAACGGGGSGGGGVASGSGGGDGNGNGGDGSGGPPTVQSLPEITLGLAMVAPDGDSVTFTLTRTGGNASLTVNVGATARAGGNDVTSAHIDTTNTPQTVTFTGNNPTATYTVMFRSDRDRSQAFTVTATATTDGAAYTLGTQRTAAVAVSAAAPVVPPVAPALPKVSLASVTDSGDSVIFSLTRTGATTGTLVVTVNVTATNDYVTSPPTMVTFEVGDDTATLTIPLAAGRDKALCSSVTVVIVTDGSTYLLGLTHRMSVLVAAVDPPPPPRTLTYQADVFQPSSDFRHWCASPRPDTNDLLGTNLHEKFWIRSFNDEWYLWYDEVEDVDPASVESKITYFHGLKTPELHASGTAKDQFRFTEPTERFEQRSAGTDVGYGMELARSGTSLYVLYTEPDSPAETAGLRRGAQIKSYTSGALSPTLGASHTFTVRDRGASEDRTVTMKAAQVVKALVQNVGKITMDTATVGYMAFHGFQKPGEAQLAAAVKELQGVDDLVLDLRYNRGGRVDLAAELGYMIAGSSTVGQLFTRLDYNDKQPDTDYHVASIANGQMSLASGTVLPTLGLGRVFVLSSASTCSASELIINGLRGLGVEVVLIGNITCGKPYGFWVPDNCGTTYYTIMFRAVNKAGVAGYHDGFVPAGNAPETTTGVPVSIPGCYAPYDNVSYELGDSREPLLSTALHYRQSNGACPMIMASPPPPGLPVAEPFPTLLLEPDPARDALIVE